jgi:hypothetical protein
MIDVLLDSDYKSDFPSFCRRSRIHCRAKVKVGRKVYIKINSSDFHQWKFRIYWKTYREAVPIKGLEEERLLCAQP